MPAWQGDKATVEAAPITALDVRADRVRVVVRTGEGLHAALETSPALVVCGCPKLGDYLVIENNHRVYWSTKEAFERVYQPAGRSAEMPAPAGAGILRARVRSVDVD